MRLRPLLAVTALTLAALPAFGSGAASSGGLSIRLVDAPTSLRDDPRAHIYIIDHVAAGTVLHRTIEVGDTTQQPLSASLYVGGAAIDKGVFAPTDKGVPSELGSWSSVTPSSVSLRPNEAKQAKVTIAVPKGAADGERYGVIWAELPVSGGGAVKAINRVGIRIYLSVGNGSAPASDFAIEQLQASRTQDGIPVVSATVRNTGGRALDMSGQLSLGNGPGGLSAGPFPAKLGTTLGIGQTEPVTIPLSKAITNGPWKATLTLKSDLVSHTATAEITFPAPGATAPPVKAKASDTPASSPWTAVAIVMIALLAVLLVLAALRHRRSSRRRTAAA